MRAVTVVAVAAVLGVASSAAAHGFPFPKSGGAFIPAPQESKPVISLTLKNREEALRKLQSLRGGAQPTVVCGMTIIPATPDVDPKSIKKAPTDKKYTMRTVPRPMCGQEASTVVVPPSTVAPR
jgi:hypothetical protein